MRFTFDYGWDCSNLGFVRNALTCHCNDFEQEGVSSSINGIHATALYIGILVISRFLKTDAKVWNEADYCYRWVSLLFHYSFYTNIFVLGMVYP